MSGEIRASNNQGSSSNNLNSSNTGNSPITPTTIEQNSRITQPLQTPSSYDFTQCLKQSYRRGKGRLDPLEVVKTRPRQNNKESMSVLSTIHPQK